MPADEQYFVPPEFGPTAQPGQTASRTYEQYFHNYLYQNGMFPQQAQAVLDSIRNEEPFAYALKQAHEGFPPAMATVLTMSLKRAAVKWIDANIPQAWFRAVFAE